MSDEKRSCATCEFSNTVQATGPNGEIVVGGVQLICMRRPPAVLLMIQKTALGETSALVTQFPPVTKDMYCYDYWPEGEPVPGPDDFDMATGERMTEN